MIYGIGTDIIEVSRIQQSIERYGPRFLDRVFTEEEQKYCSRYRESYRHYAGRFAAKEAAVKALGTGFSGGINWLDVAVTNDETGKPCIILSKSLSERFNNPTLHLSISHCNEYATAFVICMK
jgi:holo-[acyl-carrier protein] synthase